MRIACVKGETLKTTAGQGAQALGWEKTKRIYSIEVCTHMYTLLFPHLASSFFPHVPK